MCSWASRADRDGRRAPSSTDSWPPFPVPPSSLCSWVLTCSKGFGEARCGRPKPSGLRPTGRGARAVHLKQEPVWGPGAGLPLCPAGLETVAVPGAPAVPSRDIPAPGRGQPWPPAAASGRRCLSPHRDRLVVQPKGDTAFKTLPVCQTPHRAVFEEGEGVERVTRPGGGGGSATRGR